MFCLAPLLALPTTLLLLPRSLVPGVLVTRISMLVTSHGSATPMGEIVPTAPTSVTLLGTVAVPSACTSAVIVRFPKSTIPTTLAMIALWRLTAHRLTLGRIAPLKRVVQLHCNRPNRPKELGSRTKRTAVIVLGLNKCLEKR